MSELLDTAALDSLRELGDDFFRELVETFLESSREQMEAIRQAAKDADAGLMEAAAHSLKGASRQQGAVVLAECCRKLEEMGKEGDLDGINPLLEKTEDSYRKTIEELEGLV